MTSNTFDEERLALAWCALASLGYFTLAAWAVVGLAAGNTTTVATLGLVAVLVASVLGAAHTTHYVATHVRRRGDTS